MVRIGISGFGRIGRLALRRILTLPDAEVVAINNRTVGEIMAHLLKYDSVHGTMKEDVAWEDGFLVIDGKGYQRDGYHQNPLGQIWRGYRAGMHR